MNKQPYSRFEYFLQRWQLSLYSSSSCAALLKIGQAPNDSGSRVINRQEVINIIDNIFAMHRLEAVCLIINSLQISLVQAEIISNYIKLKASTRQIKVYSFIEDIAEGGGYIIACAASEVYAMPASIITSTQFSSFYSTLSSKDKKQEMIEDIQALTPLLRQRFIDKIRLQRGAKLKRQDDEILTSSISGCQAVDFGLVDGLDDVYSFIAARLTSQVRIKNFNLMREDSHTLFSQHR